MWNDRIIGIGSGSGGDHARLDRHVEILDMRRERSFSREFGRMVGMYRVVISRFLYVFIWNCLEGDGIYRNFSIAFYRLKVWSGTSSRSAKQESLISMPNFGISPVVQDFGCIP